jgi:hypothetical protein
VGHRLQAELLTGARHDAERLVAGAAARAVSDRDEVGPERAEPRQHLAEQRLFSLERTRREELERDSGMVERLISAIDVGDPHGWRPPRRAIRLCPNRCATWY